MAGRWSRDGFSYVAVLLIVAILAVAALGYASRVGVEAAARARHRQTLQADYLAHAAVRHAAYKLLTDGSFPPHSDRYLMHDLPPGRYGFKVRRHTSTTYATVATVGVVGESVVHRSYVLCID